MPICPKCHKFKKKALFRRHVKDCIASDEDIKHFSDTKSGSVGGMK